MPESFGARLRRQREERQIALSSIAEETKIKLALLEALEQDDVSHWPSGIFRRAYVRAYAHMIGLDPDAILHEFMELYPDPADVFMATADVPAAEEPSRRKTHPPTRLRYIVDSAIESLVGRRRAVQAEERPADAGGRAAAPAAAPPEPWFVPDHALAASGWTGTTDGAVEKSAQPIVPMPADAEPTIEAESPPSVMAVAPEPPIAPRVEPPSPARAVAIAAPDTPARKADEAVPPKAPAETTPVFIGPPSLEPELEALGWLCTELGRVADGHRVPALLEQAARLLGASGLIIWLWDDMSEELRPALVHGYSDRVLAQLPVVRRDTDNPTAAAFRAERISEIPGTKHSSGALVVPLRYPDGCAGVFAIELQPGAGHTVARRSMARVLAVVLAELAKRSRPARVKPEPEAEAIPPAVARFTAAPSRPMRVRRGVSAH